MRQIDNLILAAHQALVDASQRKPVWWARQCTALIFVLLCIRYALFGMQGYVLALWLMIVGLQAYNTSRSFWPLPQSGWEFLYRLLMVVLAGGQGLAAAVALYDVRGAHHAPPIAIHALMTWLLASHAYFEACKPPKPRVPRGRAQPNPI